MKCQKLQRMPRTRQAQAEEADEEEKINMCICVFIGKGELILIAHAQWAASAQC